MRDVTVGVVGIGRIGRMHLHNLVHRVPEARVMAVASPHIDVDWARRRGIPVATTDADELLHDPEIEAIVIASPSGRHVELIRRAAHFGKHIFCEKPVAFVPQAIEEVVDAVASAGVQLQVGFNRRFDPGVCRLAEAVRSGELGELHGLRIINRDPTAPPVDFVRRSGRDVLRLHDPRFRHRPVFGQQRDRGDLRGSGGAGRPRDRRRRRHRHRRDHPAAGQRRTVRDRQQPPDQLRLRPAIRGLRIEGQSRG